MKITEQQLREFALSLWTVAFDIGFTKGADGNVFGNIQDDMCTEMCDDFITNINAKNYVDDMRLSDREKVESVMRDHLLVGKPADPKELFPGLAERYKDNLFNVPLVPVQSSTLKYEVNTKLPNFTFASGDKNPLKIGTEERRYFAGFPMVENAHIESGKVILSSTPSHTDDRIKEMFVNKHNPNHPNKLLCGLPYGVWPMLDAGEVFENPMRRRMLGDWGNGVVGYDKEGKPHVGVDPAAPGGDKTVTGFKCMHGTILYGNKCIRCERLKESVTDLSAKDQFINDFNTFGFAATKVELVDDEILLSQIPKDSIFKVTEPDEADKRIDVFANKDRLCQVVSRFTSLSTYTTMLIITRTKGLTMRKLVHKALYRRGMALCGSTNREQDGQWYADHHIETVLADVMKELNHENNH